MNKRSFFGFLAAVLILCILYIPVRQSRIISYGIDTYNAHQPLYGDKTYAQSLTTKYYTTGLGTILVDLRRTNQIPNILVTITDTKSKKVIVSKTIQQSDIQDDKFAFTNFESTPLHPNEEITITLSAPEATSKNPIGVRIDPDHEMMSLALRERVPFWNFTVTSIQNNITHWRFVSIAMLASLILAIGIWLPNKTKRWQLMLLLIVITAFCSRALVVPRFGGVSGGDPYNYLSISHTISEFKNPFANTKRLPGYPLILTPFYVAGFFDDQHVMRYVQIIASITALIILTGLARALNLSWPIAIAASAILAFQKDFYWTSLRPEPYSLYTAFLLASLFFFFTAYAKNKTWVYVAYGFCLGYGAMVRQEGFMLAATMGMFSVAYEGYVIFKNKSWSTPLKRLLLMYIPALCMVLPFFIHNTATYGHPLYTEYFEGDRLQIVDSFLAFQDASGATWGVLSSMWKPSWDALERIRITKPVFIISMLSLWLWYAIRMYFKHSQYTNVLSYFMAGTWLITLLTAIYVNSYISGLIPIITAGWILASIPIFLMETKWRGFVILTVLISQIGIATWFHPFPKHYQQAYPLIILMVSTALLSQIRLKNKLMVSSSLAATTLPFFIISVLLYKNMNAEIDRYNESVALDSVTFRAAQAARFLPGPTGFDQAYLPARLYFDPNAKYFPDEDHPSEDMEQEWLTKNSLKTIVVTNGNNVFKKIPSNWIKLREFKAAGKEDKVYTSTIYAIPL